MDDVIKHLNFWYEGLPGSAKWSILLKLVWMNKFKMEKKKYKMICKNDY